MYTKEGKQQLLRIEPDEIGQLKRNLKVGDKVPYATYALNQQDRVFYPVVRMARVVRKLPHICIVNGGVGSRIETISYADIALLKREQNKKLEGEMVCGF